MTELLSASFASSAESVFNLFREDEIEKKEYEPSSFLGTQGNTQYAVGEAWGNTSMLVCRKAGTSEV